jgi:hypothetical protein
MVVTVQYQNFIYTHGFGLRNFGVSGPTDAAISHRGFYLILSPSKLQHMNNNVITGYYNALQFIWSDSPHFSLFHPTKTFYV